MKSSKKSIKQRRGNQEVEQGMFTGEFAGISDYHVPNSVHGSLSHLEAFLDTPSVIFPSLVSKFGSNEADAAQILTSISSSSYITNEESGAVPVMKRPVGRPRIHPKKELDPNRVRRVAKGDKPLGRPRTSHLKPPVEKRPRGRPRKDASKEIFAAPLDEQAKNALTDEWRSTMDSAAVSASSAAKAELLLSADHSLT